MSDQYEEYGEYEEYGNQQGGNDYQDYGDADQGMEEEDYETKVQLDYFQAEEMLRKNQIESCLSSLEQLYNISVQKQLKNWKVKILNFLLQIYCKANDTGKIKQTLERISQLNKKQKYSENSIKSIILTIKSLPAQSFDLNKQFVYGFISQLDSLGRVRSYLLFLEKAVEQNANQEAERLIKIIKDLLTQAPNVPASNLLELFSFEIVHSKKTGKDISGEVRKMQLKLPSLEAQSYMSQGHISIIKQAVAQNLYLDDNYADCALYLCEAFQDNMKYGKSVDIKKNLLKTNVLVVLLTDDKQLYLKQKYNSLYHESAASFKSEADVQCLYGMVQAWMDCDYGQFIQQAKSAQLVLQKPYENLLQTVVERLKMTKLLQIIKPYTTIKVSYLQRRLTASSHQVTKMLVFLISDNRIHGRIRHEQTQIYLDIIPPQDEFLNVQLKNIKQISKRYL